MIRSIRAFCAAAVLLAPGGVAAQALLMPVRPIGPTIARGTTAFMSIEDIRELPGGRLLVNSMTTRRLLLLDSALRVTSVVAADTTPGALRPYGRIARRLLPFRSDSSLLSDPSAYSIHVLDPQGAF